MFKAFFFTQKITTMIGSQNNQQINFQIVLY